MTPGHRRLPLRESRRFPPKVTLVAVPVPTQQDILDVLVAVGADPHSAATSASDLLHRWSETHRWYHDLRHLQEVLDRVDVLARHATRPELVRLAAWWHDAVHYGTAGEDERASARLAEAGLRAAGVNADDTAEVVRLVLLTVDHDPGPDDLDGAVLCDADLGILAAVPQRYAEYVAGVRREYAHVDDNDFRTGRAAVLRRLLDRPRLFRTATAAGWERRARANVTAELDRLAAAGP